VTRKKFLLVRGVLQNPDGVISVRASSVQVVDVRDVDVMLRDLH
jgi:hypothetical protein